MQIRTEFSVASLAFHSANNFAIYNESSNICTLRFFDKFLYDDPRVNTVKGFDYRLRRFFILRKNNTESLSSFQQLNDNRSATNCFYDTFRVFRIVHEYSL